MFVEPEGKTQSRPAASFIDDELTALEFRFAGNLESTTAPDCLSLPGAAKVGPEQRTRIPVWRDVEQKSRIPHRHVVRIEQQYLTERRKDNGIRL